jgi:ribosomal protein L11
MLKGSSTNRENVGSVTIEQVKEIATIKMADLILIIWTKPF